MPPSTTREPLSPWPFAGLVGLACDAFLIGATPLVVAAPWWAVTLLVVLWLAAFLLAIMWFTTRPRAVALLPGVVTLVWVTTVVGGAINLGWA